MVSTLHLALAARFLLAANLTNTWTSRFAALAFWRPALRVLCYHRIRPAGRGCYTVTTDQLERQLTYVARSGFHFIRVRDLLSGARLPERPLLLTFDDGDADSVAYALPVLRRHHGKATVFVVSGYAGDRARWDTDCAPLMGPDELRDLDAEVFEIALHSHWHRAFAGLSLGEIEEDVRKSIAFLDTHGIRFTPALAYPYGSRPKGVMRRQLVRRLDALGIRLAFRVGNRINRLPLADPHDIQRIVVRGDASDAIFRRKLWVGRVF